MSDDEVDLELLALLRKSLGIGEVQDGLSADTGVLRDAEYVYNNAIDVSINMYGTKGAAMELSKIMRERKFSFESWGQHELHPKTSDGFDELGIVNFVFTMDLLNFSFWSELSDDERYQVEYRDKRWTGYNSLVACLRRALDEGIPITTPRFWRDHRCTDDLLRHVFRSATEEEIPLLQDRMMVLKEASDVLFHDFDDGEGTEIDAHEIDERTLGDTRNPSSSDQLQDVVKTANGPKLDSDSAATTADILTSSSNDVSDGELRTFNESSQMLSRKTTEVPDAADANKIVDAQDSEMKLLPEIETISEAPHSPAKHSAEQPSTATQQSDYETNTDQLVDPTSNNNEIKHVNGTFKALDRVSIHLAPDRSVLNLISDAQGSSGKLVNLLVKHFSYFRDEARFEGRKVRFFKRAQIFVADLWAALHGEGVGNFHDVELLTMFADYRVPEMLSSLGVLKYSPPLEYHLSMKRPISSGHSWEVQIRGCSIWAVELIRREMARNAQDVNAVLIDFLLYDLAKEKEAAGTSALPHHRTRSVYY